jgi:hypothetical protein
LGEEREAGGKTGRARVLECARARGAHGHGCADEGQWREGEKKRVAGQVAQCVIDGCGCLREGRMMLVAAGGSGLRVGLLVGGVRCLAARVRGRGLLWQRLERASACCCTCDSKACKGEAKPVEKRAHLVSLSLVRLGLEEKYLRMGCDVAVGWHPPGWGIHGLKWRACIWNAVWLLF